MSRNDALCPACGAPAKFAWRQAIQTACPYCKAILIRHGVEIEQVGEAAELPPDASPIQLGVEGQWQGRSFRVIGGIRYQASHAEWNEWHLLFQDSRAPETGWLSDAQAQYAISFLAQPQPLPPVSSLQPGHPVTIHGVRYTVTHVTRAAYAGFQGELPFPTADRGVSLFVDLRTPTAQFATLDASEDPPLIFTGHMVPFDELRLTGLKEFAGW